MPNANETANILWDELARMLEATGFKPLVKADAVAMFERVIAAQVACGALTSAPVRRAVYQWPTDEMPDLLRLYQAENRMSRSPQTIGKVTSVKERPGGGLVVSVDLGEPKKP